MQFNKFMSRKATTLNIPTQLAGQLSAATGRAVIKKSVDMNTCHMSISDSDARRRLKDMGMKL